MTQQQKVNEGQETLPTMAVAQASRDTMRKRKVSTRGMELRDITNLKKVVPHTLMTHRRQGPDDNNEEVAEALVTLKSLGALVAKLEAEMMDAGELSMNSRAAVTTRDTDDHNEVSERLAGSRSYKHSSPELCRDSERTRRRKRDSPPAARHRAKGHRSQGAAHRGLKRRRQETPPRRKSSSERHHPQASRSERRGGAVPDQLRAQDRNKSTTTNWAHQPPLPTFTCRRRREYTTFTSELHQYSEKRSLVDSHEFEMHPVATPEESLKAAWEESYSLEPIAEYEEKYPVLDEQQYDIGKFQYVGRLMSDLMNGPPVGADDATGLQDLAADLWSCVSAMDDMNLTGEINTSQNVNEIASRFTGKVRERYEDEGWRYWERHGEAPGIEWLMGFVRMVTERTLPRPFMEERSEETGTEWLLQGHTLPERLPNNFSDTEEEDMETPVSHHEQNACYSCPLCSDSHPLSHCPQFRRMAVQQRVRAVKRLQCCSLCLTTSHTSAECWSTFGCGVVGCKQRHSKWLHVKNAAKKNIRRGDIRAALTRKRERDNSAVYYTFDCSDYYGANERKRSVKERLSWRLNE